MTKQHSENLTDIEKAKLDAFNEINKRMDEKLQSSLRTFRFVVWSIGSAGLVLVFSLGLWGYKGYQDIQKMVEAAAKENAGKIIDSPEFQKKIDQSLGIVVEQKINDLDNLSKKLSELKAKIAGSDSKQIVHNLFSEIEPRLATLEKLEKNSQVQAHDNSINFFSNGNQTFSIQFGEKLLSQDDFENLSGRYGGSSKKILFEKLFLSQPKVFVQIEKNGGSGSILEREFLQINSVMPEKDGFIVMFSPLTKGAVLRSKGIVKISWIALGR